MTVTINKKEKKEYRENYINLVGKIVADREISFKASKNALLGIWGNQRTSSSLRDQRRGVQILKGGPWCVKGHLLNLQLWGQNAAIYEVSHEFMEFWVQIHGVPLEYMERETAETIGNMLGVVVEVEDPKRGNVFVRTFLRVRVAINISNPLPTGFWMTREERPKTWIEFKYERLQDCYCLRCGIIGHGKKECKKEMAMANWDPLRPRYEPGLGVNPVRANFNRGTRKNKEENSEGQEVEERARGEHDHNTESESRHSENSRVGESKNKHQRSEKEGFAGEKETERLRVMGEEKNDGEIPEKTGKEKGERNEDNQNGEGGKDSDERKDTDKGNDIIEELGNLLQNLVEKGRTKRMGQHETSPKQKETEYQEMRNENQVGLPMKKNLDSQKESTNHKPKNSKEVQNSNRVDLCNNGLSMMEKEGSDECQSKAPTIHQLLLARWGKGREEDEEESRKKTQDIGEHKSCWKVREKQEKKPKGNSKIETQIYNSTIGERYIVEFPEEEGEEEENKEKKNTTEPWELELA
ncbi:hypothetical protein Ahy_B08g094302 isoform A [Arachis hypogaea]|uniref:CCHC-type domain-containing protein n=1 Tax=Arachis hypogaea TaxID=3818 RepID=A0A444Y8M1_ARAHY|nr:hypothetical protein Ahy_B08g094302 isoform A [Arachis hypogaea]